MLCYLQLQPLSQNIKLDWVIWSKSIWTYSFYLYFLQLVNVVYHIGWSVDIELPLQNVTQRHKVTKCSWKNGTDRLVQHKIDTKLQFVKTTPPPSPITTKKQYLWSTIKWSIIKRYTCIEMWQIKSALFINISSSYISWTRTSKVIVFIN